MKVFCFHSIRSVLQADKYDSEIRVEPTWFYSWLKKSKECYGYENMIVTFDDAYRDSMIPAIISAKLGIRTIVFVSSYHIGSYIPKVPYEVMTSTELMYLLENKVELGSHGWTHTSFSRLGRCTFENEVLESLKDIQQLKLAAYFANLDKDPPKMSDKIPIAPPHGEYTIDQYKWLKALSDIEDVYGTVLPPVGNMGIRRLLCSEKGYVEDPSFETKLWPWEE